MDLLATPIKVDAKKLKRAAAAKAKEEEAKA